MSARLGNVLFWLGIIIAVGWLLLSYYALTTRQSGPVFGDAADVFAVFAIPIVSVTVGWALRYIFGGNRAIWRDKLTPNCAQRCQDVRPTICQVLDVVARRAGDRR
jgi:hypothetical protein